MQAGIHTHAQSRHAQGGVKSTDMARCRARNNSLTCQSLKGGPASTQHSHSEHPRQRPVSGVSVQAVHKSTRPPTYTTHMQHLVQKVQARASLPLYSTRHNAQQPTNKQGAVRRPWMSILACSGNKTAGATQSFLYTSKRLCNCLIVSSTRLVSN